MLLPQRCHGAAARSGIQSPPEGKGQHAMATWDELNAAAPDIAAVGAGLLKDSIAYLATVRRDGSPRVHPVCPIFAEGRVYVAVAGSGREHPSPKRWDLLRDGRFALHAMPGPDDAEFYITGRARRIEDPSARDAVSKAAGHTVHDADWLFELQIQHAMSARWEHVGQPTTYAVRKSWNEGSTG